ncbi:MAG: DUF5131 family protein [Actinomycetota bacterium]
MSKKPGDWWDKSWNPIEGCTPISEACDHCWAMGFLRRFRDGQKPGEIRYYPERFNTPNSPLNRKRPTRYFVGSLTDMFQTKITETATEDGHIYADNWINHVIEMPLKAPQHTYCFLTKRADEMARLRLHWLYLREMHCRIWLGITAENQERYDQRWADINHLVSAVRYVSFEPLLGPVDMNHFMSKPDWVIVGGETGPGARRPDIKWIRDLRDQCVAAKIPFWFKSFGAGYREKWSIGEFTCTSMTPESKRLLDNREWSELPEGK